jgi:RNA methyltransferase, TrmH family
MTQKISGIGFEKITSRENSRIKAAMRVRSGKDRGLVFLEGVRLVNDAAAGNLQIREVFISSSFALDNSNYQLLVRLASLTSCCFEVSDRLYASLSDTKTGQGVIVLADRPKFDFKEIEQRLMRKGSLPLVLYLHRTNNPSNLGAIVRSTESAGAAGILTSNGSADAFSPAGLRGSMGSAMRLPIIQDAELERTVSWARERGLRIVCADGEAQVTHYQMDWKAPCLLILGSEAHGLPEEVDSQADVLIKIPIEEPVESLNLAVSASVILFEARRQVSFERSDAA